MSQDGLRMRRRDLLAWGLLAAAGPLAGCATGPATTAQTGPPRRYADRPPMMAIGDSLYQGVRSLSFTRHLAPFSPPAQVAQALGLEFTVPDFPPPLLYDVERELRRGAGARLLLQIREVALENLQFWLGPGPWSRSEAFDNVSVGGAEIHSLYDDRYSTYWPQVQTLAAQLRRNEVPDPAVIAQLWFALNTCLTLNPLRRDELAGKSQIDQVRDRKPRLLLVNIGSNEGLFNAGFQGSFGNDTFTSVGAIPGKMERVAEELATLPREVETIAFNSLIRPRTASNLMPSEPASRTYPGDGYFAAYGPWLLNPDATVPGSTVKRFDELVLDVNRQVQALLQRRVGSRLRYVDLYGATTALDGKHYRDRFLPVRSGGRTYELRNRPFVHYWHDFSRFEGGLTGLDNMHPSVPGYAALADAVLAGLGASQRTDKDAAFRNDTLLTDPPLFTPVGQRELRGLGTLGVFKKRGSGSA